MMHVDEICRKCGAGEIRVAQTDAERALVWKGRKAAFAAVGRISPNYIVQDGVIPRTALPQVMSEIDQLSAEAGIRVANVFHAGDGNLHPLVLYDRRIAGQEQAAEVLSYHILEICIAAGGSITGEHGVGEEKKMTMSKMFASPIWKRCSGCAARSIRCDSPILRKFSRARGCAAKSPANIFRIHWKPPESRSGSEWTWPHLRKLGRRSPPLRTPLAPSSPRTFARRRCDRRIAGIQPQMVVEPGNEQELAAVLRWRTRPGLR